MATSTTPLGVLGSWQLWALLAAVFAAATAILAKIGVEGINSDMATLVRTCVVVVLSAGIVAASGQWQAPGTLSHRSLIFLILSGLATGASWLCYFRALKLGPASAVAPIDKLSVVMVAIFGAAILGEKLSVANWLGVGLITTGALLVAWK